VRRREVARRGRRREGRGGVVGRLAGEVERRRGGEGEGRGGRGGGAAVAVANSMVVEPRRRLHLEDALEAQPQQLHHARVLLLLLLLQRRRRRRRLAPGAVRGRRGHGGAGALLLVAGVLALVRDVEHAQVGVGALHLLRGAARLRGAVRAPVVAPAMQQQQQQYMSVYETSYAT